MRGFGRTHIEVPQPETNIGCSRVSFNDEQLIKQVKTTVKVRQKNVVDEDWPEGCCDSPSLHLLYQGKSGEPLASPEVESAIFTSSKSSMGKERKQN